MRRIKHFGKPQGDIGKAPEPALTVHFGQVNRQTAHHTQPTLRQLHGACQGELAGITSHARLPVLRNVRQLVETQAFFVGGQRHDTANDTVWRQAQGSNAWIKGQHFRCHAIKILHLATPLPHQCGKGIGGRKRPLNATLQGLRVVGRQICRQCHVFVTLLLHRMAVPDLHHQQPGHQHQQ